MVVKTISKIAQYTIPKRKLFARLICSVIIFAMLIVCAGIGFAEETVSIRVDQDDLLDIVLTLGNSDSDVSDMEADLVAALAARGIPLNKIKVQAVDSSDVSAGDTSAGWEIYDHTNFTESEILYYRPYYNDSFAGQVYQPGYAPQWNVHNHIHVYGTGGQTNIDFRGYGRPAFKDFMYMPNNDVGKKIFDFTIQEGYFYDALDGAGFLFNTHMTSNTNLANRRMSGYFLFLNYPSSGSIPVLEVYRFTDIDVNVFHNMESGNIQTYPGFTRLAMSTLPGAETTRVIKIEATSTSVTMWYNGTHVNWSLTGGGTSTDVTLAVDFGAYGFGPLTGYTSHACARPTLFSFLDVRMATEATKRFSEVIREPEWRDESKRFIINAEDGAVSDFSDPQALGEILARLGNESIHYIGWGYDEADGNAFIAKNNGKGVFVDKDSVIDYSSQIAQMADYIYSVYIDSVENDTERLIYGKPNMLSISPESEKTNTADENWPDGKWRVQHNNTYYENSTGLVPYHGLYLNNLDITFTETGKYDIYYQDILVKTVYVHRKPVARFAVALDSDLNVTLTDNSYDSDFESTPTKGIASVSFAYRETMSDTWITGAPSIFERDKEYVIRQIVSDEYGVSSDPYFRYVSTSDDAVLAPIAEFKVMPGRLLTYMSETAEFIDMSYDPKGASLTDWQWTYTLDGETVYTDMNPLTDFTEMNAGTYKITLKVRNAAGSWSEPAARYLTVVRDDTAPTASCDTANGTYTEKKTITLQFEDEAGGSGFSHRYVVINNTSDAPASWGSMGTNNSYSVSVGQLGANYIHYKAVDYAGNERTAYFGPFTLADTTPPSVPTLSTAPAYTEGNWINGYVTVSASGSTDDFTASEDILYEYAVNGGDFAAGSQATVETQGTHTVSFRVTDGSGNSRITDMTVQIDLTDPTMPEIAIVSDGAPYIEDTWATESVTFTLSGSTDAGGSGIEGYQYRINSGSWQNGDTHTFNNSGIYTVSYRAVDNAGNTSAVGTKQIKVDFEAPGEPQISYSPDYTKEWTNKATTLSAALATDDMTDPDDILYEVSTNGTDFTEGSSITLSSQGVHTVWFRVTDESGNNTTVTRTVKIDLTAPATPDITMTSAETPYAAGTWTPNNVSVVLSGGADTGGSGFSEYQYKVNNGEWQSGDTWTLNMSGDYVFSFRAIDNAGNTSAVGTRSIKVDKTQPEEIVVNTTVTAVDSIAISAATTDAHSGMAPLAYRVHDGRVWSAWKSAINETLTGYSRGQTVTIKVEARDAVGNTRLKETTATTLVNSVPVARDDVFTMREDAPRTVLNVLANDSDADIGTGPNDSMRVTAISALSNPAAGRLTLSNGVVAFTPASDWFGTVSFTYTIRDEMDAQASASATIRVTPVNDPPIARDDHVTTDKNVAVWIDVLANDEDVDSVPTIKSFGSAANGIVSRSAGGLRYTPNPGFFGEDSFKYTITDGEYDATATVYVKVRFVNDAPVAAADRADTYVGQAVMINVLANDYDIQGSPLTITAITKPENGTAQIVGDKVRYTPKAGFVGTDSFTYTVSDGELQSTATVTITVSYPDNYTPSSAIVVFSGGGMGGIDSQAHGTGGSGSGTGSVMTVITPPSQGNVGTLTDGTLYSPVTGSTGFDSYRVLHESEGIGTEYQIIMYTNPQTGHAELFGYGRPLGDTDFELATGTQFIIELSDHIANVDWDNVSISVNGQPFGGKVEVINGKLVYTPQAGFSGMDAVVITMNIGNEEIPFAAVFNVKSEPLVSIWCIIGWIIAAILLTLNGVIHRLYFKEKKLRPVLYVILSAVLLFILCWLRLHIGYLTIAVTGLYIVGCYLYAAYRNHRIKKKSAQQDSN